MKKLILLYILLNISNTQLLADDENIVWKKGSLSSSAYQVAFSNNGKYLAVQEGNYFIRVYNTKTMEKLTLKNNNILRPIDGMLFMNFSKDDDSLNLIFCTSTRCYRKQWDLNGGELIINEELDSSSALRLKTSENMKTCALLDRKLFFDYIKYRNS